MSTLATDITQVVFPLYPISSGTGHIRIIMSRTDPSFPGAGQYTAPNANTLLLSDVGPALLSDLELNQSEQLTTGFAALDAISLQFRDCTEYAGTLGDGTTPLAEDLWPSTFFTDYFNDTAGATTKLYPVIMWIVKYANDGTTEIEKAYLFHIAPNYKPQSDQLISSPQTADEALNDGTVRTIQAIEIGNLINTTPWQNVLNVIGAAQAGMTPPCVQGAGYMGFAVWNSGDGKGGVPLSGGPSGGSAFEFGVWNDDFNNNFVWTLEATPFVRTIDNHTFNTVAPSSRGTGPSRPFWPADNAGTNLNFDPTNTGWFGPAGTWWISLGDLYTYVAKSFGQLSDTDASFTAGSNVVTSASAKFTASLGGRNFYCSSPDGAIIADTVTFISSTQISITHTFTNSGSGFYWWIEGDTNQQLEFDLSAQMGSTSSLATNGMQRFKQLPDNTNKCYPVDTAFGAILAKDTYISVNAFFGAHPADGRQWLNPIAFNPSDTLDKPLPLINNFLLAKSGVAVNQTSGKGELTITPIGSTAATWPDEWQSIGTFQEVEPSTSATAVVVSNVGSDVALVCPFQATPNPTQYVVGPRLKAWADTQPSTDDRGSLLLSDTFGVAPVLYDPAIPMEEQAADAFQAFTDDGTGKPSAINDNCWKGLCYAMFKDSSNTNIMYPSDGWFPFPNGNGDGGWSGVENLGKHDAFYALGVQYGPRFSAVATETNPDRFDSISYQSVVLGTFNVQTGATLLQRDYFGSADASGLLSTLNVGMKKQWEYDGALRYFTVVELPRFILGDVTIGVKWRQSGLTVYPDITALSFGPAPGQGGTGGGTGGSGGGTSGGSTQITNITNTTSSPFLPQQTISGSGTVTLPSLNITAICGAGITALLKPTALIPGQYLAIKNASGAAWTHASGSDFYLIDKQTIIVQYDGSTTAYDPTLPAGFSRMAFSG